MNTKLHVAVLCGGQSPEHEVSVNSAKNVVKALDKNKYQLHIIYISKAGEWFLFASEKTFLAGNNTWDIRGQSFGQRVSLVLGHSKTPLLTLEGEPKWLAIDVVFPVLHGGRGEDGTMQGLLELANLPYVGPGVLASAICMDKEVSKRLLREANLPIGKFISLTSSAKGDLNFNEVINKIGLPFFVKPANTGSSVGISKVKQQDEFQRAVELAFHYDNKILLEEFIAGREIETAVLGNGSAEVALPGEVVPHHEFYSYEAKYLDPDGASLVIPAKLPEHICQEIKTLAKKVYFTLGCESMTRVDFFLTKENEILINEANTIPGFTQISMYPKMWLASGVSYSGLLDKLITLALERFERNQQLMQNMDIVATKKTTQIPS